MGLAADTIAGLLFPLAIVLGSVVLALITHRLMRLGAVRFVGDDTRDLAASVTFRVAALHALILGLVFAQETHNYQNLEADLVTEATAVTDLFYDFDRYGPPNEPAARLAVARYALAVVETDWPRLREAGELAATSYALWGSIYEIVLDLEPTSARQDALRDHMLGDVHRIADLRQKRVNAARGGIPSMFWVAAVGGLIFVSLPYFIFPPTPVNVTLLVIFSSFTGLVLAIIHALSDPFSPPAQLVPDPFIEVISGEVGELLSEANGREALPPGRAR